MSHNTIGDTDGAAHPEIDVRAIGRDPVALEGFYRAYVGDVQRFVARRLADPHSVADVTSDVFMKAMSVCKRFDPSRGAPRAWLYGIAYNVIAEHERQAARRWGALNRAAGRYALEDDAISDLEDRLDAQARMRRMRDSLAGLSKADRALLELTAIDGLTIADAALALNMTAGTARVRLHRARQRLEAAAVPHTAAGMPPPMAAGPDPVTA